MKQTIITTMLALIAMTGWAQQQNNFTISGDLSVMTNMDTGGLSPCEQVLMCLTR